MPENRLSSDLYHRLGATDRLLTQPRTSSSSQDDRFHRRHAPQWRVTSFIVRLVTLHYSGWQRNRWKHHAVMGPYSAPPHPSLLISLLRTKASYVPQEIVAIEAVNSLTILRLACFWYWSDRTAAVSIPSGGANFAARPKAPAEEGGSLWAHSCNRLILQSRHVYY